MAVDIPAHVRVVPASQYQAFLGEAVRVVASIDADDVPFVALAKALDIPLWTSDKRLRDQAWVTTVDTATLLRQL